MREHLGQRMNRTVNQPRAVVEWHDSHAFGQAGLQLDDLLFDPLGHVERVFAVAHHDHAADRFVAVFFEHAAAELRAEADGREIADGDRRACGRIGADDDFFDIALRCDPTDAADEIFGIPLMNHPAADGRIRAGDCRIEIAECDAVGP